MSQIHYPRHAPPSNQVHKNFFKKFEIIEHDADFRNTLREDVPPMFSMVSSLFSRPNENETDASYSIQLHGDRAILGSGAKNDMCRAQLREDLWNDTGDEDKASSVVGLPESAGLSSFPTGLWQWKFAGITGQQGGWRINVDAKGHEHHQRGFIE